jgi:penicillin-binding protein 2
MVVNLPAYRLKSCEPQDASKCSVRIVSKDQAIGLQAAGLKPGQFLNVSSTRSYLFGKSTAHLLGYVSEVGSDEIKTDSTLKPGDYVGRGGVEEEYDRMLRGRSGKEIVEVDAAGGKLRTLTTIAPKSGQPVNLSIDMSLQKVAYQQISGKKAAVIVTNPKNGEVLALVSSPSFDPNLFTELSADILDREREISRLFNDLDQPLFDRAIAGTYPPGSTFKIVSATAGLELGKISEETTIDDPGILIVGPYRFANWKYLKDGGTQGTLNVVSALRVSNDIFFYKLGEAVGVDGLSDWALRYGLAKKTNIDLPGEASGSFPTKQWRDKFARSWYLGDTYHLAIGQADMLVTPLQVNRWTAVIANEGKLCRPRVLQSQISDRSGLVWRGIGKSQNCTDLGLHKKTLDLIKQGMIEACSPGGTAYPLFNFKMRNVKGELKEIRIACKTGTAEFGDSLNKTHAWLTAYAPAENPTIVVTVVLEAAGEGSDVASPVVKKILEEYFAK